MTFYNQPRLPSSAETGQRYASLLRIRATFTLLMITVLALGGCQSLPSYQPSVSPSTKQAPKAPQPVIERTAEQFLMEAERSSGIQRTQWLLHAAEAFIKTNDFTSAESLITPMDYASLPIELKAMYLKVHAELLLVNHQYPQAVAALTTDTMQILSFFDRLAPNQQSELLHLRARAHEASDQFLAAARTRVLLSASLNTPQAQIYNNDLIWQNLSRIELPTLRSLEVSMPDTQLRGWIELAIAIREHSGSLHQQLRVVERWQARWTGHVGQRYLPNVLRALNQAVAQQPKKVALLLPTSGHLSQATAVVRDGFMAGFYADLNAQQNPPQVVIIDTHSTASTAELYTKAQSYGVDMIIGPLEKKRVQELAQMGTLPIPTLSLNYVAAPNASGQPVAHNLYQFGLAAEDEAVQIAEHAALSGYRVGAVLYPDTDWGLRTRQAFESTWMSLGGITAGSQSYTDESDYRSIVKQLMEIDHSQARARTLRQTLNRSVEFTARRREDLDFIVMLGNTSQARQLKPTLNFYFAADLPTFATSNIYAGRPEPKKDKDLDGVAFTEMPWMISDSGNTLPGVVTPPEQMPMPRLFALGVDAYALSLRLHLLKSSPSAAHNGFTGRLSLSTQNRIQREPVWAKFEKGKPETLAAQQYDPS